MDFSVIYQICRFPKSNNRCRYSVRKITYKNRNFLKYEIFQYGQKNLTKLHKEIQKSQFKYFLVDSYNLDEVIIPKTI